jgi:beta-phosphoglucomutase family hydrolase
MLKKYLEHESFAGLLFDFDGTLADTMGAHLDSWNKALKIYDLTLSREQHLAWAGRPTREIVQLLNELHVTNMTYEAIAKEKEKHYLSSLGHVKEIVPVAEIVRHYHRRIPMAIVTGSRRKWVELTMKQLALTPYFDTLVCAEDYVNGKPAPDCFLKAAQLLNVAPENCLVFEDGELGIQAAKAAKMVCLRVTETHQINKVL